jgi:flagellar hook-basal body complex protein FliE
MSDPITNMTRLVPGIAEQAGITPAAPPITTDQGASTEKFTDMLSSLVNNVNELQGSAAGAQQALMNGEPVELHQVMIKAEEAGLSMDFLLEIRNKLVNAYNEVMRMPM